MLNHPADKCAGRGSNVPAPPDALVQRTLRRLEVARKLQASLAGCSALKLLMPPREDKQDGYTESDLRNLEDWVLSLATEPVNQNPAADAVINYLLNDSRSGLSVAAKSALLERRTLHEPEQTLQQLGSNIKNNGRGPNLETIAQVSRVGSL